MIRINKTAARVSLAAVVEILSRFLIAVFSSPARLLMSRLRFHCPPVPWLEAYDRSSPSQQGVQSNHLNLLHVRHQSTTQYLELGGHC